MTRTYSSMFRLMQSEIFHLSIVAIFLATSSSTIANAAEIEMPENPNPVRITATTDRAMVQIAEPFTAELALIAPAGSRVVFPSVPEKLGPFDVLDHKDVFDVPSDQATDQRVWKRQFTLESIVGGELKIPELDVQVSQTGEFENFKSEPVSVRVSSVLEERSDPSSFRDIHSVVDVAVPRIQNATDFWWVLGGASGLGLTAIAFVLVHRRRKWMNPEQWAIRELDAIEHSDLIEFGESIVFWGQLSRTLREFLEMQFGIPAPAQTTDELMCSIATGEYVNEDLACGFETLLSAADQARFSGRDNSSDKLRQAIAEARSLVIQSANQPGKVPVSVNRAEAN